MAASEQTIAGPVLVSPSLASPVSVLSPITSATRIPVLDGIRGVAILLVLLCHSVFESDPHSPLLRTLVATGRLTWSGVDLFFVLSGFLIGGILLDARESPNYFKTFYVRRAFRILPLYGLMVGAFSIRFIPFHWMPHWLGRFSEAPIPWLAYPTFTQNIWMALYGTFGVGTMAATWSLAVEEQFYLTAPLVVRKTSRSRLMYVLGAVIVGAPLLRTLLMIEFRHGHFANYVLTPCRADALSLGVLAALMVRSPIAWKWLVSHFKMMCLIASILFGVLAVLTYLGYDATDGPMVTVGYSCLGLFYTTFLLIAVTHSRGVIHRVLCQPWLMELGVLAYFTYLVHLPMMEACRRGLGIRFDYSSPATQVAGGVVGIGMTLLLAKLSWKYFEKPLLRKGHAWRY